MLKNLVRAAAFLPVCGAAGNAYPANGADDWGGVEKRLAVVNSVTYCENDPMRLSLRGEWYFCDATDKSRNWTRNLGAWSNGYQMDPLPKSARKIMVPGCWEAQGVGTNSMSVPWACHWDSIPQRLRHCYTGEGFYRKDVKIPQDWAGRRIWIKVGGVSSQGWLWVNDNQVAWLDTYCGTYKYEITEFVRPGEVSKIVCEVSNALPSRRGCLAVVNHWGGIVRDVELESTPEVFIDDAWVRGDYDRRMAEVHVSVDGGDTSEMTCRVNVEGVRAEAVVRPGDNVLSVPLRDFRPWSPASPSLYVADIEILRHGQVTMRRRERFGVRKIESRGKDIYLNGKPLFVRGAGWHPLNPKDGEDLPDRETYVKKMKKVLAAGFNLVRMHTHCKWPEFFEVADELGLMIQPELPYYNDFPTDRFEFNPIRDARELWEHYRRYPSFVIYSCNNEGWFGKKCSERLYEAIRSWDKDRLVNSGDASFNQHLNHRGTSDFSGGPPNIWPRGSCDTEMPFICHEYLNISVKFDTRIAHNFNGAVWEAPYTRDERRRWLQGFGLDMEVGDRLQDAQNRFQAIWIKHGLETARLDPYCDGYSFWSLQDCMVPQIKYSEAYAAQALFDIFWGEKRCGLSVSDMARFNGRSVLLLDTMPAPHLYPAKEYTSRRFHDNLERIWCEGDVVPARVFFAHFENEPFSCGTLKWELKTKDGRILTSGSAAVGFQDLGHARELARLDVRIPKLVAACAANFAVRLDGKVGEGVAAVDFSLENDWDMWLFPKGPRLAELRAWAREKGVVVAMDGSSEANSAIKVGGKVVTLANQDGSLNSMPGWWWMGDQVGTVLFDHPALKYLPHDGLVSPLLFKILKNGMELPFKGGCQGDMIVLGEGGGACYSYMHLERFENGAKRIAVTGLDLSADRPESNAILKGAIEFLYDVP